MALLRLESLTTGQIATMLAVSQQMVIRWMDTGRLKGWRLPAGKGTGNGFRRTTAANVREFCVDNGMPVPQVCQVDVVNSAGEQFTPAPTIPYHVGTGV